MIIKMKETLESESIPDYNENCESCVYLACSATLKQKINIKKYLEQNI